ncbi:MAG TPA: AraC family transcriptional regulator [Cyclobacteriaceae bacterium]|nr:AraC family transcriptional regulator [Cyclobacteriaceae bacterium]
MIRVLLLMAGFQSLLLFSFLAITDWSKKGGKTLCAFALLVAILCFFRAAEDVTFYISYPHLMRVEWGMLLLLWPLIYLFIRNFLDEKSSLVLSDWMHFMPYLVNLIILLPFFLQDAEAKLQALNYYTPFITQGFYGYSVYYKILSIGVGVQSVIYTSKIVSTVNTRRARLEELLSNTSRFGAGWFYGIVYGMVGLTFLYLGLVFLNAASLFMDIDYVQFFYLGLFVIVILLSYRSFYQPFKTEESKSPSTERVGNPTVAPYSGSGLSELEVFRIAREIDTLFENDKIYLSPDLTLADLASRLGIPRQYVSQVLTQYFGKTFFNYVNQYRVEEFKRRHISAEFSHLTLLGLALECGFNSKATFNSVFKRVTGSTPSQFARHLKKST